MYKEREIKSNIIFKFVLFYFNLLYKNNILEKQN